MAELAEFLLRFFFGCSGAVVILFLRIFEQLPRMSKSSDIILLEDSLKDLQIELKDVNDRFDTVQKKMSENMLKDVKPLEQARVDVEELKVLSACYDIRIKDVGQRMMGVEKEIRSMKLKQWAIGAFLFTFLGGVFAVFVPDLLGGKSVFVNGVFNAEGVAYSLLIGATWTTYISLIEGTASVKQVSRQKNATIDDLVKEVESKTKLGAELFESYNYVKSELENYKRKYEELDKASRKGKGGGGE
jgi:hypothetical protein